MDDKMVEMSADWWVDRSVVMLVSNWVVLMVAMLVDWKVCWTVVLWAWKKVEKMVVMWAYQMVDLLDPKSVVMWECQKAVSLVWKMTEMMVYLTDNSLAGTTVVLMAAQMAEHSADC